jgi:D-alanyl-D-alanine carboxypeptidase/D-alanyl-D-alanine-endopeptidase (penicillin-binding protein 4)
MHPRTTVHRVTAALTLAALGSAPIGLPAASPAEAAEAAPVAIRAEAATRVAASPAGSSMLTASERAVRGRLATRSKLAALGPDLAGLVTDAGTGKVLWSRTPRERQIPASNVKLVTAVNALTVFGPRHRIETRVLRGSTAARIVLVGGGDPSLSSSRLKVLARRTAAGLRAERRRSVSLYLDDSLFARPSLAIGWKRSYVPSEVAPVRALVVDRHHVRDTATDAQRLFARQLRGQGIRVGTRGRTRAAGTAAELASVWSPRLFSITGSMLRNSRNDYAEALHRLVARKAGRPATWRGARAAQRKVLASLDVDLGRSSLHDGSGLSRANRLTPSIAVRLLSLAFDGKHPALASLRGGALAVSGRTGTLSRNSGRYTIRPTRCAAGRIQAKTGSLNGVVALSGFTRGTDGRVKLFSFMLNQVPSTLQTRRAVDRLATTVTGCW